MFADCETAQDLEKSIGVLESSYRQTIEFLEIDDSLSADAISFNLWVTPRMMFIAIRKEEIVAGENEGAVVALNTLGFTGTMALKNQ